MAPEASMSLAFNYHQFPFYLPSHSWLPSEVSNHFPLFSINVLFFVGTAIQAWILSHFLELLISESSHVLRVQNTCQNTCLVFSWESLCYHRAPTVTVVVCSSGRHSYCVWTPALTLPLFCVISCYLLNRKRKLKLFPHFTKGNWGSERPRDHSGCHAVKFEPDAAILASYTS